MWRKQINHGTRFCRRGGRDAFTWLAYHAANYKNKGGGKKKCFKRLLEMCQGQGFSTVEQNYNLEPLNFKHTAIPQRVTGM